MSQSRIQAFSVAKEPLGRLRAGVQNSCTEIFHDGHAFVLQLYNPRPTTHLLLSALSICIGSQTTDVAEGIYLTWMAPSQLFCIIVSHRMKHLSS